MYFIYSSATRLQDYIRRQEMTRNDLIEQLTRKIDIDKEMFNDETRRLNDRIELITIEVSNTMTDRERRMRDEFEHRINLIEAVRVY